jgi:adenosylcobinamide-GDP ribazoletransferase
MRVALSFLTRIPVGSFHVDDYFRALGRQTPLFPLVGALVGAVAAAADLLAGLAFGPLVRAAAAVAAGVWVTGALHLDGLMDTADGLGSHRSRERMLEIMRDSRVGAMGVIAGVLGLAAKFALVAELPPAWRWQALVAAPAVGRMAMAAAAGLFPSARRDGDRPGLGAGFAAHVGKVQVAGAALLGLAVATAAGGLRGAAAWAAAMLVALALAARISKTLGGLTGDTYGAVNEGAELAALAVFAAGVGL